MNIKINNNKKILSKKIYNEIGISQAYNEIITNDLIFILKAIIKDGKLNIKNFGTFKILNKKERIGRNPKTKKIYTIEARKSISFKTSQIISSTKILSVAKGKWGPCCSTAPNGHIIVDLLSFEILLTSGQDKFSNSLDIDLKFIIFNFEY